MREERPDRSPAVVGNGALETDRDARRHEEEIVVSLETFRVFGVAIVAVESLVDAKHQ